MRQEKGIGITKIAVLHPQGFVRELLREALETRLGLDFVAGEADFEAFEAACQRAQPDAAIIDDRSTNLAGSESLRRLAENFPNLRAIVIGHSTNSLSASRAVSAGVKGYVDRRCSLDTLLYAVRSALNGTEYICPKTQILLHGPASAAPAGEKPPQLSPRELEVLRAIAEGKMTKQIAEEQGRSIYTIENQRRRILRKTGFSSVAQITLLALELGLIKQNAH